MLRNHKTSKILTDFNLRRNEKQTIVWLRFEIIATNFLDRKQNSCNNYHLNCEQITDSIYLF